MMNKKKFIAFYLPQYHSIPENDTWWGKNFTEWVRVKSSKPLFGDHYQPRVPYEYYDLSDINVMIKQSKMALKFGIFGFCYYHYWFNGKLLLEKPIEQMLNNKDIDIPFCLAWANEPWTRAWDGNNKQILMPQEYGSEQTWLDHLKYLIPFFKDKRYIKINNKPLFLIYRTESFRQFDQIILHWDRYLKKYGFEGLFVAEMLTSYQKLPVCTNSKAVVEFEPMFTLGRSKTYVNRLKDIFIKKMKWFLKRQYRIKDYDEIWDQIIKRNTEYKDKIKFLGAFTDWDNTPRFKDKSLIFLNSSAEKFESYLLQQVQKSQSEFIFINAWNEWAEGAYLEPDSKNGFKYLEAIRSVLKRAI